ncbi:MAG: hypothetical protein ACYS8Z_12245 [Planctomycetota bacterium]
MILAISLAFGSIVFVRLIGSDSWLIRGLRCDKLGAIIALCSILLCGALIFFLLRFSLSHLQELPLGASAASEGDLAADYTQNLRIWDVILGLLTFCTPIVTAYLLSLIYRGICEAVRRLALR